MSGTPSAKLRVEAGQLNRILSVTINTLFLDIEHSNYKRLLALKVLSSRTILVELLFCFFFLGETQSLFYIQLGQFFTFIASAFFCFRLVKFHKSQETISLNSLQHTRKLVIEPKSCFFLFFFFEFVLFVLFEKLQ